MIETLLKISMLKILSRNVFTINSHPNDLYRSPPFCCYSLLNLPNQAHPHHWQKHAKNSSLCKFTFSVRSTLNILLKIATHPWPAGLLNIPPLCYIFSVEFITLHSNLLIMMIACLFPQKHKHLHPLWMIMVNNNKLECTANDLVSRNKKNFTSTFLGAWLRYAPFPGHCNKTQINRRKTKRGLITCIPLVYMRDTQENRAILLKCPSHHLKYYLQWTTKEGVGLGESQFGENFRQNKQARFLSRFKSKPSPLIRLSRDLVIPLFLI